MGQHNLISRRPRCRPCPKCGRLNLLGIDEGVPFRVEPLPLTVQGEIRALLNGQITYGIHAGYVCFRDQGRMTLDAKWGRPPVCATHKCDFVITSKDIEPGAVGAIVKLIDRATAEKARNPDREESEDEHIEPIYTIWNLLKGKVIAEGPHGQIGLQLVDLPPF